MLATILIAVMILLQTGASSLVLMVDCRYITAAAGLKRKLAPLNKHNRERRQRRRTRKQGGNLCL